MTILDCPRGGENLAVGTGIPVDAMSANVTQAALQDLCQGLTSDGLPASLLMRHLCVKQQCFRPEVRTQLNRYWTGVGPEVHLAVPGRNEYLDIVDNLEDRRKRVIDVIRIDDDNRMTADIVTPLEKVTPLQWTGASLKIMARLIQSNKLNVHGVLQYQAYMAMLTSLAESYTWVSILQFDRRYRSLQAVFEFSWGTDVPCLMLGALCRRSVQQASKRREQRKLRKTRTSHDRRKVSSCKGTLGQQPPRNNDKETLGKQAPSKNGEETLGQEVPHKYDKNEIEELGQQAALDIEKETLGRRAPHSNGKKTLDQQAPRSNSNTGLGQLAPRHISNKELGQQGSRDNDKVTLGQPALCNSNSDKLGQQTLRSYTV